VNSDAQIDQSDQSQSGKERPVGRHEDKSRVKSGPIPFEAIDRFLQHAYTVELLLQSGQISDGMLFQSRCRACTDQTVARFNSGIFSRTTRNNTLCYESAILLQPPCAVIRCDKLAFFLEVNSCKDNCGDRENCQNKSRKPN